MLPRRVNRPVIAAAIAGFLATAGSGRCEQAPSGSEAHRAALCAGDYVCDEDGSWATAGISPDERAMRLSRDAMDKVIAAGKVDPDRPPPTQRLAD